MNFCFLYFCLTASFYLINHNPFAAGDAYTVEYVNSLLTSAMILTVIMVIERNSSQ